VPSSSNGGRSRGPDGGDGRQPGAWGILGGTFDPVHYGHLALAEGARQALGLEGVLFLPAGIPPHKPDRIVTAPSHRAAMVELAIADNPAFRLCRAELDRPGPSYAVDTAAALVAAPPVEGADPRGYVWLLSVEALVELHTWREPQRLLELVRSAPCHGPGSGPPAVPG